MVIKDFIFIIDKSTSMFRIRKEVEKVINDEINQFDQRNTNRITIAEIDNEGWNIVAEQILPEQLDYKFKPYSFRSPNIGSIFIDSLCPLLQELKNSFDDCVDAKCIFICDTGAETSNELNFNDVLDLLKEFQWESISPLHKFGTITRNNYITYTSPWTSISTTTPLSVSGIMSFNDLTSYTNGNKIVK